MLFNTRYSTGLVIVFSGFLATFISGESLGQRALHITFINDVGESILVYFQPEGARSFLRPPLNLPKSRQIDVPYLSEYSGKRYVVVRTEGRVDFHVGWYDLDRIARSNDPRVLIDKETIYETRTETYTICKPVWEIIIDDFGNRKKISKMVPEERTREHRVKVPKIQLKVGTKDGWQVFESAPSR
jgi:hypothetical protein